VLVVEDEDDVRALIRLLLERAGIAVIEASNGADALRWVHSERPDAIVLDVTMPVLDGWRTLERIRDVVDTPVLMLTARTGELNAVRGLRAGADDYVTKPFGRQELVARVKALLRRSSAPTEVEEIYRDGAIEIDFAAREVRLARREVPLTPLEFKLLAAFVRHPNQTLSRDQLLELVWGEAQSLSSGNQVKLYVGYLRRKLGLEPSPIQTVRGFGYRYRPPGPARANREREDRPPGPAQAKRERQDPPLAL
jgi:DNA-binding response OmpR family regulator